MVGIEIIHDGDGYVSQVEARTNSLASSDLIMRGMEPNCVYEHCFSNGRKVQCFYNGSGCAIAQGYTLAEQDESIPFAFGSGTSTRRNSGGRE